MPGMSGLEVARRIKSVRPWLPVVIVTEEKRGLFGAERQQFCDCIIPPDSDANVLSWALTEARTQNQHWQAYMTKLHNAGVKRAASMFWHHSTL